MFSRSKKVQKMADSKSRHLLEDKADTSCTTGYDNDGSVGTELFENGFDLAQEANGREVFEVESGDNALFFIGTEEEVLARISALPDKGDEDEDEDEDGDEDEG